MAVRKVIRRTLRRRSCSGRKATIRYRGGAGQPATAVPPGNGDPSATGGPPATPPWHGCQVKIEDLPSFTARWGLVAVRGEWPKGETCPKLYLVGVEQWQTIDGAPASDPGEPSECGDELQSDL